MLEKKFQMYMFSTFSTAKFYQNFAVENDARKAVETFCIYKVNIVDSKFYAQNVLFPNLQSANMFFVLNRNESNRSYLLEISSRWSWSVAWLKRKMSEHVSQSGRYVKYSPTTNTTFSGDSSFFRRYCAFKICYGQRNVLRVG